MAVFVSGKPPIRNRLFFALGAVRDLTWASAKSRTSIQLGNMVAGISSFLPFQRPWKMSTEKLMPSEMGFLMAWIGGPKISGGRKTVTPKDGFSVSTNFQTANSLSFLELQ